MSDLQQLDEALSFLNLNKKKNNHYNTNTYSNKKEELLPEIKETIEHIRTVCKELSKESKWDTIIKSTLDKNEDWDSDIYPSFRESIYVYISTNKYIQFSCFDGDQDEAIFCEDIIEKYAKELEKKLKKICDNINTVEALTGEDHSDIINIEFKS